MQNIFQKQLKYNSNIFYILYDFFLSYLSLEHFFPKEILFFLPNFILHIRKEQRRKYFCQCFACFPYRQRTLKEKKIFIKKIEHIIINYCTNFTAYLQCSAAANNSGQVAFCMALLLLRT